MAAAHPRRGHRITLLRNLHADESAVPIPQPLVGVAATKEGVCLRLSVRLQDHTHPIFISQSHPVGPRNHIESDHSLTLTDRRSSNGRADARALIARKSLYLLVASIDTTKPRNEADLQA